MDAKNERKIAIGVPHHDYFTVPWRFAISFIALVADLMQEFGVDNVYILAEKGTVISEVRNNLLTRARQKNVDYLLMVDSDMTFTGTDAKRLIGDMEQSGADLVSGLYFAGSYPCPPQIYKDSVKHEKGVYTPIEDYPKDDLFPVDGVGMGFCLFGKKAIYDTGFNPFDRQKIDGFLIGEDFAFCRRAKDRGLKIMCDSGVKLGHLRMFEINEDHRPEKGWT